MPTVYTIKTTSTQDSYLMPMENCTITGNSVAYKVNDGEITKYDLKNGKINEESAQVVNEIELTNYQYSILDELNDSDGNEVLSKKDLSSLNQSDLEKNM